MAIKILLVEDEVLVAEDIAADLMEYGFNVVDMVISGEECLQKHEQHNPDVVIMDINIKGKIDGIETAKLLNEKKVVPIVYLTANSDLTTMQRVLDTFPAAFISKPYTKVDLIMAIELAFNSFNLKNQYSSKQEISDSIFIKTTNQYKKIKFTDILYIEAAGSYSTVRTRIEELAVSYNLSHFEKIIPPHLFKRIHRSCIINIEQVDALETNAVIINNKILPVSKPFYKEIMGLFKKL